MSITPISLLKMQANIDTIADDELLQHYLDTAEAWISEFTGLVLADLAPFPATLKQATLMLASYWYEQREAISGGVTLDHVPLGALDLVRSHRNWSF